MSKETEQKQIETIAKHVSAMMETLNLDLTNAHFKDTPRRVARMYVEELFVGLQKDRAPKIQCFENTRGKDQLVLTRNIRFFSTCAHHFLPVVGEVHIAYLAQKKLIGLSKINRLVHYCARRPQLQEHFTQDLVARFQQVLETPHLAVCVDAIHFCVISRGVSDGETRTYTSEFTGHFKTDQSLRQHVMAQLPQPKRQDLSFV